MYLFPQDEATYRAIKLAELVNVPLYVVHVMSSVASAFVREARAAGQRVIGEAVASGFASSEAAVFHPNFEVYYCLLSINIPILVVTHCSEGSFSECPRS